MNHEKFQLRQFSIGSILGMIEAKQFVIPEIQRPFVWKRTQVRDLIDSLYNGYPTGYIITWKNPDVQTKDGGVSNGRNILIDGQQRVTALMTALSGIEVLDDDFNNERIKIAYNPLEADASKRFAVQDASHLKNKKWIPDISEIFKQSFSSYKFTDKYHEANPEIDQDTISEAIDRVKEIANRQIGVIELDHTLDIDEVTEIFIRINSKGISLSQSDFVMSKMAADEEHNGNTLRKVIDYFCHLAVKPEFNAYLKKDRDFQNTDYAAAIKWVAKDNEEIYRPDYGDILRVAFMYSFGRGRLADLVSLLSGRDFETREFKEEIIDATYQQLDLGIRKFINEYNFKQFILTIKGAGYISPKLLNSQMTLDFAYLLYLKLLDDKTIPNVQVKRYVQKWFVLATLTGRYVTSPESVMSRDIRNIDEKGFVNFINDVEQSVLSDTFWEITLPQNLETSSVNSPSFKTFCAAQVNKKYSSLFMSGLMISDLITVSGDVHHIFPREYLKKNGINNRGSYNQVANYTYLDPQVNKAISDQAPNRYFGKIIQQMKDSNSIVIGNIRNEDELKSNLSENAIPEQVITMTYDNYDEFLNDRRRLMANMIRDYYRDL